MSHSSKTTTDHEAIKQWVEERDGRPATVKGTSRENDAGLLRIEFPGFGRDQNLEEIDWDKFFTKFDQSSLAFLYQDQTKEGKPSRFFKFVRRHEGDGKA
jgi:hypothetical protein